MEGRTRLHRRGASAPLGSTASNEEPAWHGHPCPCRAAHPRRILRERLRPAVAAARRCHWRWRSGTRRVNTGGPDGLNADYRPLRPGETMGPCLGHQLVPPHRGRCRPAGPGAVRPWSTSGSPPDRAGFFRGGAVLRADGHGGQAAETAQHVGPHRRQAEGASRWTSCSRGAANPLIEGVGTRGRLLPTAGGPL